MFGSQSWQVRKAESTQKGDRATHSQDKYRQGSRGEVVEVGEPWGPVRGVYIEDNWDEIYIYTWYFLMNNFRINLRVCLFVCFFLCISRKLRSDWGRSNSS